MPGTFASNSVAATEAIAARVVQSLNPDGDCIALHGDLGAGKTQFTRGLVKALGGDGSQVSSPTFVLLNVYQTPVRSVFHLDAYRLTGPDELAAIGFDDFLQQHGVVVVEWAERVNDLLPADHLVVRIIATGVRSRQIEITRASKSTGATGNVPR